MTIISIEIGTRADAALATLPAVFSSIATSGFASTGDGGHGSYYRVANAAAATGGFRSADRYLPNGSTDGANGGYWALVDQVVNPRALGAKGDGSTSDQAAMQAAIAIGRDLRIPAGTYMVTGLSASVANQTITLDPGARVKLMPGAASTVLAVAAAGVVIQGGHIDGNRANVSSGTAPGISNAAYADVTVRGVKISGVKGYGLYAHDAQRMKIIDNDVTDTASIAIFHETLNSASVDGLRVYSNTVDRVAEGTGIGEGGIKLRGAIAYPLTNAIIRNNRSYLPHNPTDTSAICCEYWYASNSQIGPEVTDGGNMGLSLDGVVDSETTLGTISSPKTTGYELVACQRVATTGGKITGGVNPVSVSGTTPYDLALTGIVMSGHSDSGIKAQAANGINITGCRIAQTAGKAIELIATQNFAITGNNLTGAGTATKAIILDASYEGVVTGNNCYNFTQHGLLLFATSAVTFDYITISGNTFRSVNVEVDSLYSGGAAGGPHIRVVGNTRVQLGSSLFADHLDFTNGILDITATGVPNGAYSASVGSIFRRTDGGALTTLYVKETGSGNTGWVAK